MRVGRQAVIRMLKTSFQNYHVEAYLYCMLASAAVRLSPLNVFMLIERHYTGRAISTWHCRRWLLFPQLAVRKQSETEVFYEKLTETDRRF